MTWPDMSYAFHTRPAIYGGPGQVVEFSYLPPTGRGDRIGRAQASRAEDKEFES